MDGSATAQVTSAASPADPDAAAASAATPPATSATDRPAGSRLHAVPVALAATVVAVQISYPLLDGDPLRVATVVAVLAFAAASLAHAAVTRGAPTALGVLVVAGGLGLLAETVGVRTGVPFGEYDYADSLGAKLLGVPVVVPLAWTMMAWPCLLLGRRLAHRLLPDTGAARRRAAGRRAATAVLGAVALASWDLYLDPQMVAAGHWTWRFPEPALPGVPGIPLTNYAGWLLVALVMVAALDAVVPDARPDTRRDGDLPASAEAVPAALLAWTWLGSGLANLAFFGRPAVAGYGLVAMGVVVGPYLADLLRALRADRR